MGQPAWTPSPTKAALLVDFSELLFQFSRFRSDGSNDAVIPRDLPQPAAAFQNGHCLVTPRLPSINVALTAGRVLRADTL